MKDTGQVIIAIIQRYGGASQTGDVIGYRNEAVEEHRTG